MLLTPELLLHAYRMGVFPMANSADDEDVYWVEPHERGVLPLNGFHISKNLRRHLRNTPYVLKTDTRFADVMRACAQRPETWINAPILEGYQELHRLGYAHSLELFLEGELVGGFYGVSLGAAFFGESLFQRQPEAHKAALAFGHRLLVHNGYRLWDAQFYTDHLGQFGAQRVPQTTYLALLQEALKHSARFTADLPAAAFAF